MKLFVSCCILFDKHFYLIVVQLVNHSLYNLNEVDLLLLQIFHCLLNVMKSFHFALQKAAGPERRSQAIVLVLSARECWSVLVISAAGDLSHWFGSVILCLFMLLCVHALPAFLHLRISVWRSLLSPHPAGTSSGSEPIIVLLTRRGHWLALIINDGG